MVIAPVKLQPEEYPCRNISAYSPQVKREKPKWRLYRNSSHVNWRCTHHIVWTPKYRFRILKDKMGKELYRTIHILCGVKDCEVLELNVQPDHLHLVVIVPPKISISTLMGHLKGRSVIRLYNRFPHIRKKRWGNHFVPVATLSILRE
jgi:putative transposase